MPADGMTEGEHVEDKQDGAEHWALRDTTGDIVSQWFNLAQRDMLSSPRKVNKKLRTNYTQSQRDQWWSADDEGECCGPQCQMLNSDPGG